MKIYLLYANPYDDGSENYGVFSTEEKAEKAREVLASKSNHELYVSEMEVDGLERLLDAARLPERLYTLFCRTYAWKEQSLYGEWSIYACGLDSFLEGYEREDTVVVWKDHTTATVKADSEENALKKVLEMIKEGNVLKWQNE